MTSSIQIPSDASALLREAAEWRLVNLLLECPGPGWLEQIAMLADEVSDATLKAAVEAARQEASPSLYHNTFGPGGPAAPREVSHRRGVLPGASLAELRSLYEAFAYEPSLDEPPDHVAVEAGFVAYLRLKQAYACACGNDEQSQMCTEVGQRFMQEHLSRVAAPLAKALASSGIMYLIHAADALQSRTGPAPVEVPLDVLSDDETDNDE